MNYNFLFFSILIINIFSTHLISKCNKLKLSSKRKNSQDALIPNEGNYMNPNIIYDEKNNKESANEKIDNGKNYIENQLNYNKNNRTNNEEINTNINHIYNVQNKYNNIKEMEKMTKSYEDMSILEENSKKLQNDIHSWIKSVHSIEEKTSKLKNIKNDLLNNIISLNKTLLEEIENINEIKKLQNEQNEIFSENLLYFFPSMPEKLQENIEKDYNILNYLEIYNKKDNLKKVDTNLSYTCMFSFFSYLILLSATVLFFL
ncbi:apical merozoite protein, putative [Plasmodium berghei]|uniref:Apical merozoite protein, putative n=2 Tax=Plasmodium berghei TaxID=5821 RepID=A0A509AI27_PLABA|nr:apical merozoite protein, putative [Plasmodium berghei ANKA]CXI27373.1 apical merozoite protein, putative [Plasmodium berghei]SCM20571.1 apical merozoite protein, putative [Plasmodium berghei]SCN24163.1 apical merozoite protein, putative [Plasmodium berghei]SCO59426.1 apical merozoite protein, putative [Plasmodium berghei]SCO60663.1 apical merozoite protein, putative [Plasmodium berghei]|eukprot:XP_034420962.1 apical merozoite protein, putative [Plasmodium berghei ANKA]